MPEVPDFDQFSLALKSKYDEEIRGLEETLQNSSAKFDLELIDSHLAAILPDSMLEYHPREEDRNVELYRDAIQSLPWMGAVWQARRSIQIVNEIRNQEGEVPVGGGNLNLPGLYAQIQEVGPLSLLVRHLRIQSFPALPVVGAESEDDVKEFHRQYAEANEKLIDLLSQAL